MNNLFFWNKWEARSRILYLALASLFLLSIVLCAIAYFINLSGIISWETIQEFAGVKVPIDQFSQNLVSYTVEAESYLIKEFWNGSEVKVNPIYAYIYLIFLIGALMVLVTCIT